MTSVTNAQAPAAHATLNRPNMVSVGTMVWLASELMFFAGLFAMYFSLRSALPQEWAEGAQALNVPFALANTVILVSSSVTAQFGVWKAEEMQPRRTGGLFSIKKWGMIEWFYVTFVLGAIFVGVQAYEFAALVAHEGLTIASGAYGSAFYITTGFHGLHVIGGLIAFLLIIGRAYLAKRFGQFEATAAIVVSYYWHFVDVVWIALFLIIYFLK